MKNSLIQWPRAKYWTTQWNPYIGCTPCSPACENCYAAAWAQRFGQSFAPHETKQKPPRKGVVFCGNMTDLFGEWVPRPGFLVADTRVVQGYPTARNPVYLWLTKRVSRMVDQIQGISLAGFERSHYFGFTAENQSWYDQRYKDFRKLPTLWNGWLSAEPLLGAIDLGLQHVYPSEAMPFQWVVVGCESGPKRRPCKIEWIESIVEQCRAFQVPVFVKQISIGGRCVTDIEKFPEHLQIRQVPWTTKEEA